MKLITAPTIGVAWAKAYELVMLDGRVMKDGEIPITELMNLYISIEDVQSSDRVLDELADPKMIDWMVNKNFGSQEPLSEWGYSYGMRMHDWSGVDQITESIKKLQKRSGSKAATISLLDPKSDFSGHMPCIVAIDPKIRDGQLSLTAFFRSQDIGTKFYADVMALASIQKEMANALDVTTGNVDLLITSAHVPETAYGLGVKPGLLTNN